MEQRLIFLSHTLEDKDFAELLAEQIELEVPRFEVQTSSNLDVLPSESAWLDRHLEAIDRASALILLLTEPSDNLTWIGFLVGYFWKKAGRKMIYVLYHPSAVIASPLDALRTTPITDSDELRAFFQALCTDVVAAYRGRADITRIARQAELLRTQPSERNLANFERLLETSTWDYSIDDDNDNEVWTCADDPFFQISLDPLRQEPQDTDEEWTRRFAVSASAAAPRYAVKLKIAGNVITSFYFVSVDAAKYFVPQPEARITAPGGERQYVWQRSSLSLKLAKIVGDLDCLYPTLEVFAAHAGIKMID